MKKRLLSLSPLFLAAALVLAAFARPAQEEHAGHAHEEEGQEAPKMDWEEKEDSPAPASSALVAPGEKPAIILCPTGNLNGYLEECGCVKIRYGSLARRMAYAALLQKAFPGVPLVHLDAGNFCRDTRTPDGRIRSHALVRFFNQVGLIGANAALTELADTEYLDFLQKEASFPIVSASWKDKETGTMLLKQPYFSYTAPGGKKIAFLGLYEAPGGVEVDLAGGAKAVPRPAGEVLKEFLPKARASHDYIILLASMPEEKIRAALKAVRGVDLVIAAEGIRGDRSLVPMEGVPVMYVGYEGRTFHEIRLFFEKKGLRAEGHRVALADWMPVNDETDFFVQSTLNELSRVHERDWHELLKQERDHAAGPGGHEGHDHPLDARLVTDLAARNYAGAEACASCHAEAHAALGRDKHARAMESLLKSKQQDNPVCVGCHVTGQGKGGYRSLRLTPHFAGVQCEACHGPSSAHAARPETPPGATLAEARYVCYDCHDKVQSPKFDYDKYMLGIRHWGEGFPKASPKAPAAPPAAK